MIISESKRSSDTHGSVVKRIKMYMHPRKLAMLKAIYELPRRGQVTRIHTGTLDERKKKA